MIGVADIIETVVVPRLDAPRKHGSYWMAKCPAHTDRHASLGVKPHKDGTHVVITCFTGCDRQDVMTKLGLDFGDLYPGGNSRYQDPDPVAEFLYTDISGTVLYKKVKKRNRRTGGKFCYFEVPDGKGGWRTGAGCMDGVQRVLYRLPQLWQPLSDEIVWYCEGEKDALALASTGEVATTAGSVSDWKPEFSKFFKGREVIIVADKDAPGMAHACAVYHAIRPVAEFAWIVTAKEGKDASDHLRAGYGVEHFEWIDLMPDMKLPVTR